MKNGAYRDDFFSVTSNESGELKSKYLEFGILSYDDLSIMEKFEKIKNSYIMKKVLAS
jgi:hypothetical protein